MLGSARYSTVKIVLFFMLHRIIPTYVITVPKRYGQTDWRLTVALPRPA